jgi:hypothetical protein
MWIQFRLFKDLITVVQSVFFLPPKMATSNSYK